MPWLRSSHSDCLSTIVGMSSGVQLRPFEERDLDEVHALVVRTIRHCYPAHYPPRAVEFFVEHHRRENIAEDAV